MNKKFFTYYQYIGPAILTPLSFWLWWSTYDGNITLTLIALLVPILFAYIVPGIGTNVLKVWEFNTKYRLGKFRPHHGFVFGSATSFVAWLCHFHIAINMQDVFIMSFIFAIVLGVLNVVYDIKAIKAGILIVYNQPWADGKDAKAIAMDYAPVFFGVFGLVYGFGLGTAELFYKNGGLDTLFAVFYFVILLIVSIFFPIVIYRQYSFYKYGHSGCRPIEKSD